MARPFANAASYESSAVLEPGWVPSEGFGCTSYYEPVDVQDQVLEPCLDRSPLGVVAIHTQIGR